MPTSHVLKTTLACAAASVLASCSDDEPQIKALYNPTSQRVEIQMIRELEDGETMLVSTRRGRFGTLDCAAAAAAVATSTMAQVTDHKGLRYYGPIVDPALLQPFYGPEWAYNPTPEMLAALAAGTDAIIDFCVVEGDKVVEQIEFDLYKAIDNGVNEGYGGKADDNDHGEVRVSSAQEYGEMCVGQLGEIPFFEKQGDFKYGTYNCLDSTPIPMTVTDAAGATTRPEGEATECDKPQYIYSLCEQGPRVASRINDQGTRWVLLCRKSIGGLSSDKFNDIAMIGNNPFTGKTCFFQNALYEKTNGGAVPHPADREKSTELWSGVHGGLGSGIECSRCHDADAFIHTPWIDGAKDSNGRAVIPRMGEDLDYPIGANDMPYALVNQKGQGWGVIESLTSPAAAECTKCHRMGKGGEWQKWVSRIDQTDGLWEGMTTAHGKKFENAKWMPPDLAGVSPDTWGTSKYQAAIDEIKRCTINTENCPSQPIPTSPGGQTEGNGKLRNSVRLGDATLSERAVEILGRSGCKDCHTSSRNTYSKWASQTREAEAACLANIDGGEQKTANPAENVSISKDETKTYGPYDVAIGGEIKVKMTGSGDADLYVKRFAKATKESYDCRPFKTGSRETCGEEQFKNFGPGKFYVTVIGKGEGTSKFSLDVEYKAKGDAQKSPADIISCLRNEPREDSPFLPQKLGMYTVLSGHGWFSDVFHAAYADNDNRDAWVINFAKFKNRTAMPKGSHPRLSQEDADVVVEWFARGVPNLDAVVPAPTPPSSCTDSVTSGMNSHIAEMSTGGWRAVNRDAGIAMYGCGDGNPRNCLGNHALAGSKSYGEGWDLMPGAKLRVLREFNFKTFFWMRSSADGRFIGNGQTGGTGAAISDLQRDVDIPVHASYDPGFFPDNSGFMFQNTPIGAGFCSQNLLTSNPAAIKFDAPQCSSANGVGLYQHLASGLGSGDHSAINGQFTSDNGGTGPYQEPLADFQPDARIKITPLTFDGNHYLERPPGVVDSPFEGDNVLSPSGRLVISRLAGPGARQLGFVIRRITTQQSGTTLQVRTDEVGRYCHKGGKPAISFDERYAVLHHYVEDADAQELGFSSVSDPAFAPYREKGASNIYILDLATGVKTRVTNLKPGQFALFPHFRSDNWIYFLVRDANTNKEYALASDAALVAAGE